MERFPCTKMSCTSSSARPKKKNRPIASGRLPIGDAWVELLMTLAICATLAYLVPAILWARRHGAHTFAILTTRDNAAAQGVYASLGMVPVEQYHYRQDPNWMEPAP